MGWRAREGSGEERKLQLSFERWMQFKQERAKKVFCPCAGERDIGVELWVVYTERGQDTETLTSWIRGHELWGLWGGLQQGQSEHKFRKRGKSPFSLTSNAGQCLTL